MLRQNDLSGGTRRYCFHYPFYFLKTPVEFFLSDLHQMFNFLMKVTTYTSEPLIICHHMAKSMSEVYSLISVDGEKPKTTRGLKPYFPRHFKWFIENAIPHGSHNDFVHPLQSLFLYSLLTTEILVSVILFSSLYVRHIPHLAQILLLKTNFLYIMRFY